MTYRLINSHTVLVVFNNGVDIVTPYNKIRVHSNNESETFYRVRDTPEGTLIIYYGKKSCETYLINLVEEHKGGYSVSIEPCNFPYMPVSNIVSEYSWDTLILRDFKTREILVKTGTGRGYKQEFLQFQTYRLQNSASEIEAVTKILEPDLPIFPNLLRIVAEYV